MPAALLTWLAQTPQDSVTPCTKQSFLWWSIWRPQSLVEAPVTPFTYSLLS